MPYSNELLLALPMPETRALAARLGIEPPAGDLDDERAFEELVAQPISEALGPILAAVHRGLLERRFTNVQTVREWGRDGLVADTPAGRRQFGPLAAYLHGDSGELGDRWPTDFLFGISLASRYRPRWIDWREEHGTSGDFVFDAETTEMIEEARDAIAAAVPEFASALVAVKLTFY